MGFWTCDSIAITADSSAFTADGSTVYTYVGTYTFSLLLLLS
jgi:hypothetical protein